jgi:hypothetical protein
MGLDMYLHARKRNAENAEPEEAIYWRKANAIHGWFGKNVCKEEGVEGGIANCKDYAVSREKLVELRDTIRVAVETRDTSLLPPTSGFFYGSTEVDEGYWIDLNWTANRVDAVLSEYNEEDWEFEYWAWW